MASARAKSLEHDGPVFRLQCNVTVVSGLKALRHPIPSTPNAIQESSRGSQEHGHEKQAIANESKLRYWHVLTKKLFSSSVIKRTPSCLERCSTLA